jgi:hypothetical protein
MQYGQKWWYRHVCAIGAVGNILMMMAANLVGFVLGTKGIQFMVERLFGTSEGEMASSCVCCDRLLILWMPHRDKVHDRRVCMYIHRCAGDV